MAFEARSTEDIYDAIATELSVQSGLTDLQPNPDNSQTLAADLIKTTRVAIWRVFSYTIAYILSLFETNLENYENEIETTIQNNIVGNIFWLIGKSKKFQYGDTLTVNEDTYEVGYEVEDTTKQIVKFVAVEEKTDQLLLKCRGESAELTTDQKTAFQTYINKIKVAGSRISVRSSAADEVALYMNIIYSGERRLADVKTDVESVINNYLKNIEFNSKFKVLSLVDALQEITGLDDIQFIRGEATPSVGDAETFYYDYSSYAGWLKVDGSISLDDSITYIQKTTY